MSALIDDRDWDAVSQHMIAYDEKREVIIKKCRDVQKLAKQAIYSLHRSDMDRANQQLKDCESQAKDLLPILVQFPLLRPGSYSAAMEELAEAVAFKVFLEEQRLVKAVEVPFAEPEEYLGGILDFTGELNRYAVRCATVRDKASVQTCRDLVDAVMGHFLQLDLRNSALRKKYDALKYTVKKLENTLYELSLTESLGLKRDSAEEAPEEEAEATAD